MNAGAQNFGFLRNRQETTSKTKFYSRSESSVTPDDVLFCPILVKKSAKSLVIKVKLN